jgi:hypothetical protein
MRVRAFMLLLSLVVSCASRELIAAEGPTPSETPPNLPRLSPLPSIPMNESRAAAGDAANEHFMDPIKEAAILRLMEVIGREKQLEKGKSEEMTILHQRHTNASPKFWELLDKYLDVHALMVEQAKTYNKYYSLDDLQAMTAFYESPAGQHMLKVEPQVVTDDSDVSREWARQAFLRVAVLTREDARRMPAQPASTNAAPVSVPGATPNAPPPVSTNAPPAPTSNAALFPSAPPALFPTAKAALFPSTNAVLFPSMNAAPATK